jgi:sugar phosphate isomerase/epimerase
MGLSVAVCDELFFKISGLSFRERVDQVAKLGEESGLEQKTGIRPGIEFALFVEGKPVTKISPDERDFKKRYLEGRGIEAKGGHWILAGGKEIFGEDGFYIPSGPHITTSDTERRNRSADYAIEVFKYLTELAGKGVVAVWGSPGQRNLLQGVSYGQAEMNAADAFARILRSNEHEVTIALERLVRLDHPTPGVGETDLCYTMTQVSRINKLTRQTLTDAFREKFPQMGSMLDVKAAVNSGQNPLRVLKNPFIVRHVHCQDPESFGPPGYNNNGEFLGPGHYDFKPLVTELVRLSKDYDVCMSLEPFDLPHGDPSKRFFTTHDITPYDAFKNSLNYLGDLIAEAQSA